jgi:hypothetical protein
MFPRLPRELLVFGLLVSWRSKFKYQSQDTSASEYNNLQVNARASTHKANTSFLFVPLCRLLPEGMAQIYGESSHPNKEIPLEASPAAGASADSWYSQVDKHNQPTSSHSVVQAGCELTLEPRRFGACGPLAHAYWVASPALLYQLISPFSCLFEEDGEFGNILLFQALIISACVGFEI